MSERTLETLDTVNMWQPWSGLQNRMRGEDGPYLHAWSLMRNHTDTRLVSDVNLLGAVTWRQWPRAEVIEAGGVLFREGSAAGEVFWIVDGAITLIAGTATRGLRRGRSLLGPFISGHPPYHDVSAIAVAPTRFYRFTAADFRERLADPLFMERARPAMSQALQATLDDYTRGCLREPEQRLAADSHATKSRLPDARVIKALTLIDNSYSREDFGLGELGREMKVPAWHLSRLLKEATGMTFGQLRNAVRVERARVALLTTELSVKEIAAGVGYTHPTDLTRQFRAVHAVSPIAYRAQARRGTIGVPALRSAMPLIATAIRQ